MDIELVIAKIVIEGKQKDLTVAIAKRLPVLHRSYRWDLSVDKKPKPEAICRIHGASIGESGWLLLCQDDLNGLHWEHPFCLDKREDVYKVQNRGMWYDILEDIPVITLM